jgi:hypothetical protein
MVGIEGRLPSFGVLGPGGVKGTCCLSGLCGGLEKYDMGDGGSKGDERFSSVSLSRGDETVVSENREWNCPDRFTLDDHGLYFL